ncbi:MAG: hypothetical protein R2881_02460 [Eubacteriales bacterium]
MYFKVITSGSLEEHIYLLGADGTTDTIVIDPGEAQPALNALNRRQKLRYDIAYARAF